MWTSHVQSLGLPEPMPRAAGSDILGEHCPVPYQAAKTGEHALRVMPLGNIGELFKSVMGNRWGDSGKSVRLYFGGFKITADCDCSHEIKRRLLLGRKVMTNLDSILKSGDITLSTKVHLVKAMVFPVAIYGCESWTVKKAEHRKIYAFELWCWRRLLRLLRVPWTARKDCIGKTDAEAETPVLWPPHVKS